MTGTEWVEELHDAAQIAKNLARRLQDLGYSLRDAGNPLLAEKLEDMSRTLTETDDRIVNAVSQAVGAYHGATEAGTTNMIRACLAMADRH